MWIYTCNTSILHRLILRLKCVILFSFIVQRARSLQGFNFNTPGSNPVDEKIKISNPDGVELEAKILSDYY